MKQFIKKNYHVLVFVSVMIFLSVVLFYRAFYGMDITDETFYFATTKRFYNGDMLFKDDWNRGQIFGLILLPLYKVYVSAVGNADGIILFSRLCFVVLEIYAACFLFRILMKYTGSFWVSLAASICVCAYVRGNIITISYYSLGFFTFLLAVLWYMRSEYSKYKRLSLILSGINFSVSVLCMPYTAVLYFVLLIYGLFCWNKKRYKCCENIIWFTFGIALAAVVFLVYFNHLIPWKQLLEFLPVIFQDPELEKSNIWVKVFEWILYLVTVFLKYTWPLYLFTFVAVFWGGKNKRDDGTVKQYITLILLAEFIVQSVYVRSYFEGGIITTFWLFAVQLQLLYPECRNKKLEKYFLIPGILFGLVWIMGSNVGQRVMNMSFMLMDMWAIPMVWKIGQRQAKKVGKLLYIPVCLLFSVLFVIRMFDIYRDGALQKLDTKVDAGIMKGIYTEENRALAYKKTLEVLQKETSAEDVIAVLGCNPWVYLESEAACGSYTTWQFTEGEQTLDRYYKIFPERIPNIILVVPDELNRFEYWKYSSHGTGMSIEPRPELNTVLQKIVNEGEYKCLQEEGVTMYYQER